MLAYIKRAIKRPDRVPRFFTRVFCKCFLQYLMLTCLWVSPSLQTAYGEESSQNIDLSCDELNFPAQHELFDFQGVRARYRVDEFSGLQIRQVEIVTLPVFNPSDPNENHAIYRFVNNIHSTTQDHVVRRQLLFLPGDTLSQQSVAESERILRSNSYLSDAMILPRRVCGKQVDLVVVTRELWTFFPKFYLSRKGGFTKYGLTIEDKNILGSGNRLFIEFIDDRERNSQTIGYSTNQLFGTRVTLGAEYGDTTDGLIKELKIELPFFSLDTRWSFGLNMQENKIKETLEMGGNNINAFDRDGNSYSIFAGYSPGLQGGYTQRYSFGLTRSEAIFSPNKDTVLPEPENRILVYPWVSYSLVENNFVTYRNLNALYQTEDVPIGIQYSMLLGLADEDFDSDLSQWIFSLNVKSAAIARETHFLLSEFRVDGRYDKDKDDYENTVATIDIDYHWLIDRKNRFFLGLSYDFGVNLSQDALLKLGGDEGLRGYPSEFLLGERRLLLKLEQRYVFSAFLFNLFRFAGVVFLDVGQTTIGDNDFTDDSDLIKSTGIGLRFNSSKTSKDRIVHLDLAFPLDKKDEVDEYLIRITSSGKF